MWPLENFVFSAGDSDVEYNVVRVAELQVIHCRTVHVSAVGKCHWLDDCCVVNGRCTFSGHLATGQNPRTCQAGLYCLSLWCFFFRFQSTTDDLDCEQATHLLGGVAQWCWSLAEGLSLPCAWSTVATLRVNCPLWVRQLGQLSLPWVDKWLVIGVETIKQQTRAVYGCRSKSWTVA